MTTLYEQKNKIVNAVTYTYCAPLYYINSVNTCTDIIKLVL